LLGNLPHGNAVVAFLGEQFGSRFKDRGFGGAFVLYFCVAIFHPDNLPNGKYKFTSKKISDN